MDLRGRTLSARFCHAPSAAGLDIHDALIAVAADGTIDAVVIDDDPGHAAAERAAEAAGTLVRAPPGTLLLPGLVDLHIHAPQYPQLGTALQVPLEAWLRDHTFPLEARYADAGFALRVYDRLVADLLGQGTTTAVYFSTIHQAATRILVECCLRHGQRALVGKVAMDRDCPDFYRDRSAEAALSDTAALIEHVRVHPGNFGMVLPVVTPRFVPACSDALLRGLGDLAAQHRCHVQTQCSESDWQHDHAWKRFGRSDAEVLDGFGLLTRQTVLAHGVQLSPADFTRIAKRGLVLRIARCRTSISATPSSRLREAMTRAVRIGLGTDIAGGPSASMLDSCRTAVAASRMLEDGVDAAQPAGRRGRSGSRITMAAAFHLATVGGAAVLDLPVGQFQAGLAFDAILVDPNAPLGSLRVWDDLDGQEAVAEKILYGATRANIAKVWVAGLLRSMN